MSGVSISPSPLKVLQSNPAGLQSQILWGLSSHCQAPRLESLTWGSELSLLWENFYGIIIFQWVIHPAGMGFYFTTIASLLLSCCDFFVFGCRISFLLGSSFFLLMVVHQLIVILVFFFPFIFISWRLITLQYCSGFCHTLT